MIGVIGGDRGVIRGWIGGGLIGEEDEEEVEEIMLTLSARGPSLYVRIRF